MSKITWDNTGERLFETGVDHGVFYPMVAGKYEGGVAWNGLITVTESPSGAEPTPLFADNIKYLTLQSAEEFGYSIEAYMYPEEFKKCDGSAELAPGIYIGQQKRSAFGFAYRSRIGNDIEGDSLGYKLHLIYNSLASPSEKTNSTVNDSPEAGTFSWECTTTPVNVTGHQPTATIEIDSTKVDAAKLAELEAILYGSDEAEARMPLPDEIAELFAAA